MIWVFVTLGVVAVFVVAAVTVGREAFRLGHQPPPTIFDLDEAVGHVADDLPPESQARLTYDEVRQLIREELDHLRDKGLSALPGEDIPPGGVSAPVVMADNDTVAWVLGRAERAGLDVSDDDVYQVITLLHAYLGDIGAIGPQAGPGPSGDGDAG